MNGGRFDFDDGGTYCGGWEEGKAHGYGVCTGPQGKGEYAGAWHYGFEVSGVYTWPSGNTYQGQWQNGKRHGLGIENRGKWIYKGEWTQGYKGRYGQRKSLNSPANYLGTWSSGFHDGYGTETYVDGGSYQGQWQRGMRYGYGIRKSAAYGVAVKFRSRSHTNASMTSLRSDYGEEEETKGKEDDIDESEACKGGFVLRSRSDAPQRRRRSLSERSLAVKRTILSGLRIKKQHSTGDIHQRVASISGSLRSSGSTMSCASVESHGNHGISCNKGMDQEDKIDDKTTETYKGEWKNDKRSGFGICERSDGLKYEGEWLNNRKNGYGITYFKDGTKEEGRYKNNILIYSTRRKGIMFVRSSKLRERIESSVEAAKRAASIAQQKAEIAVTRTMTAKERAELSIGVAEQSREDAELARIHAKNFDPSFKHPGNDTLKVNRSHNRQLLSHISGNTTNHVSFDSSLDPISNQVSFDYSSYNQGNNTGGNDNIHTIERPPMFGQYSQHPSQDYTTPEEEQNISTYGPKVQFQQQLHHQDSPIQHHSHHNLNQGPNNPHQNQIHYYQYNTNQLGNNHISLGQNSTTTSSQYYSNNNNNNNNSNNNNVAQQPPTNIIQPASQDAVNYHQQYNNNINPTSNNDTRKNVTNDENNILTSSNRQQSNNYEIRRNSNTNNKNDNNINNEQQLITTNNPSNSGNFTNSSSLIEDHSSKGQTLGPNRYNTNLSKTSINASNFSLNDDHYEQYKYLSENDQGLKLRRNRPSLMRQADVNNPDSNHFINRRSTLAGSRDRPPIVDTNIIGNLKKEQSSSFDRGSLPNLVDLSQNPVTMHREDASRLASQRRQEAQRLLEEEEMLRNNPFRYFTHPSLRNWLLRYRIPLILIFANLFLLYILVQLLTYKKNSGTGEE
ncbi:Junctophilin [Strongyloides ratti]|uniref:Junctophilin n=1 Tax=Strongyloides ratti TaxID=34506 RepID=A0A090LD08_STRRB|nr:Junctophilin [Strongyloides ratti]CEF65400.1 Junctophilin [Strongyloides ratti]